MKSQAVMANTVVRPALDILEGKSVEEFGFVDPAPFDFSKHAAK